MAEPVLTTRGLTKRYGGTVAADHIDMTIEKGQIYGLVGRNGAGKTTIIRMITAQSTPSEGELTLFGAHTPRDLARMRSRTGAMVETAQLLSLSDGPAESGVLPHPAGHSRKEGGGRGAGGRGPDQHGPEGF